MLNNSVATLGKILNAIAAVWLALLAFIILYDVIGRGVFNSPLSGAREVIGNSVVAILFLQIPLAIQRGSMIRTTFVYDLSGRTGRRIINSVTSLIGIVFFLGVAFGGWADMITGWETREFEGIGAREIPVYPVRTITVFISFLAAAVYLLLFVRYAVKGDEQEKHGW